MTTVDDHCAGDEGCFDKLYGRKLISNGEINRMTDEWILREFRAKTVSEYVTHYLGPTNLKIRGHLFLASLQEHHPSTYALLEKLGFHHQYQ